MKIDEKQFEQIVAGLNIDDRPNAEHKKALRLKVLTVCEESPSRTTGYIQLTWSKIINSKAARGAIAAMIIVGVFFGIYKITGSIDGTIPAFADVVDNVLAQKWVYMFEEDRRDGTIDGEYWYNPREQKVFFKSHTAAYAFILDLATQEKTEYRDEKITISKLDNFEDAYDWITERMPMISGLLEDYEEKGAVITQKSAVYNNKPAWLYEIEISFPDEHSGIHTCQYIWLVDIRTNLPIICEYKDFYFSNLKSEMNMQKPMTSRRYAFDYCDDGPADIYALGAPKEAEIEYTYPSPEIQDLTGKINNIKAESYRSYAAVIIHRDLPEYLIVRDGRRIRKDYLELKINYSDYEPQKDKYLNEMGNTFNSIYEWMTRPNNILRRNDIYIAADKFGYNTSEMTFDANAPVGIDDGPRALAGIFEYCWWSMPSGEIVEDDYSKENGLICCQISGGHKYYYDPTHNYFCVLILRENGDIAHEITDFAVTPNGMLYPKVFRQARYSYNEDRTGTYLSGYDIYRIYATDFTESLKPLLDPTLLPNYMDHRQLTRELIEQRQADIDPSTPVVEEYTGFTPLHMAIYRQDIDRVKRYLSEGAEVEPDTDTGASPMELAVAAGNLELVKLLHEYGADFYSNDAQHRCCLGLAVENGYADIVQFMIALGTDVNAVYKKGNAPLHYAADNGDIETCRALLEHGADIDPLNQSDYTPLAAAVNYYSGEVFSQPADEEVIKKYQETIQLLVDNGADINRRLENGNSTTILSRSVSMLSNEYRNTQQHVELIQFLLDKGANSNLMARSESPLYTAIEEKRYDIAKVLLDNGADPWILPERVSIGDPQRNLLHLARVWKRDELYDFLYPYMKDRYEATNEALVESAKAVMQAILSNDTEAIKNLCIDHPNYRNPWPSWSKEIREIYTGHEDLMDNIIPGWFTLNGFADVYIPLPQDSRLKSIDLGFFLYPDGTWKCMFFEKLDYLPEFEQNISNNFIGSYFFTLQDFRNYIYDEYGLADELSTRGSGASTSKGDCVNGKLMIEVRENELHITFDEEYRIKRWFVLTPEYVKRYGDKELSIYESFELRQEDEKLKVVFEPAKCTIEREGKKYTFRLENGKILFDDGNQIVSADQITVNMPQGEVEVNQ